MKLLLVAGSSHVWKQAVFGVSYIVLPLSPSQSIRVSMFPRMRCSTIFSEMLIAHAHPVDCVVLTTRYIIILSYIEKYNITGKSVYVLSRRSWHDTLCICAYRFCSKALVFCYTFFLEFKKPVLFYFTYLVYTFLSCVFRRIYIKSSHAYPCRLTHIIIIIIIITTISYHAGR